MTNGDGSFRAKVQQNRREASVLIKAAPDTMKAFGALMRSASAAGALSPRIKELMALSIAIATRCEGCILHHVGAAMRHGASRREIVETIEVAIEMGGGPSTVYGATALAAYDEMAGPPAPAP